MRTTIRPHPLLILLLAPLFLAASREGGNSAIPGAPEAYPTRAETETNHPGATVTGRVPIAPAPCVPPSSPPEPGESWSPETHLTPVDAALNGGQAAAVDSQGRPWVVWYRGPYHSGALPIYWTRWEGEDWRPIELLSPPSYARGVYKPRIEFAAGDTAWVVWNEPDHNIWFAAGVGGIWPVGRKVQVSYYHTFYSPEVACGGGQVWLTWYGDGGGNETDVFATRWMGTDWEPVRNLSAGIPGYHWFSDIAVDSQGRAHVIWGDSNSGLLYYRSRAVEGDWSTPELLNASARVGRGMVLAAGWPMCHVEVDHSDGIHVVWVGVVPNGDGTFGDMDVYYSKKCVGGWSLPLRVNREDGADAYYPEMAVGDSDDVWFTWGNGSMMGGTGGIWAVHYDGTGFGEQQRLDTGHYAYNHVPRVVLDGDDHPWIFWEGLGATDAEGSAILYSRFGSGGNGPPVLFQDLACAPRPGAVEITWLADPERFNTFCVERSDGGEFLERARIGPGSTEEQSWTDVDFGGGTRAYRIQGFLTDGDTLSLGPVEVESEPVQFADLRLHPMPGEVDLQWTADPTIFSEFAISRTDGGAGKEIARVPAGVDAEHSWVDNAVTSGNHAYWIDGYLKKGGALRLGPMETRVEAGLEGLVLLPGVPSAQGGIDVQVGLPEGAPVTIGLYDLQGRVIDTVGSSYLERGWHTMSLQPRRRHLADGIYFLRATSGPLQTVAKVTVLQ
jgi:hypothetical protein